MLVGAATLTGGLFLTAGGDTQAARRTSSEVIAAQADRAVEALERWQDSRNPVDYVTFVQSREVTANLTAYSLEVPADELGRAWAAVSIPKQQALLSAMSQLGVPYRSLHSEEGVGFDCSGLTIWAFAEADVEIPRISGDQIRAADGVEHATAEPGDLVYYPGHVGIYLGVDTYVHSPNSGNDVEAARLPDKSLRFGDIVPDAAEIDPATDAASTLGD